MRQAVSEDQVVAIMDAVERDTKNRCIAVVEGYSQARGRKARTSRIAAARAEAAADIVNLIKQLPRKSKVKRK
jgi:hypothetical protein